MRTIRSRPASPLQRLGTLAVTGTTVAHYAERTNELVWYGASAQPIRRVMLPPMPVPVLGDKPAPASLMVHSDADDRVWVEVPRALRDSPRVWWVLTRDGQLLGSVTTPPLQQLLQIGSDFVLLRAQDSDGVAFIRRCALPVMR